MTMHRRTRPALIVATLLTGGLLISGCAAQEAGSAATLGDSRITEQQLNTQVEQVLAAQRKPLDSADQTLTTQTLGRMITLELVNKLAEREGVTVTQGEIDQQLAQYDTQVGGREGVLTAFAAIAMLEVLLGGLTLTVAVVRLPACPRGWQFNRSVAADLMRQSAPMWVSAMAVWAYLRIDQILIANLLTPTDLGRYAAAVRLAESWYFVPASIVTASFPALVLQRGRSPDQYRVGTERLLRLLSGIGIAFGLVATLSAPWIVEVLFGPAYTDAIPVFQVLAWSGLFAAWGVARENWLVAEGLTRFSPITTALGAVVNVGLNLLLLPAYGIVAAAWTTVVAQLLVVTLSMGFWPETRPVLRMQLTALAFWRRAA